MLSTARRRIGANQSVNRVAQPASWGVPETKERPIYLAAHPGALAEYEAHGVGP
jgi:hypothetical protein